MVTNQSINGKHTCVCIVNEKLNFIFKHKNDSIAPEWKYTLLVTRSSHRFDVGDLKCSLIFRWHIFNGNNGSFLSFLLFRTNEEKKNHQFGLINLNGIFSHFFLDCTNKTAEFRENSAHFGDFMKYFSERKNIRKLFVPNSGHFSMHQKHHVNAVLFSFDVLVLAID